MCTAVHGADATTLAIPFLLIVDSWPSGYTDLILH